MRFQAYSAAGLTSLPTSDKPIDVSLLGASESPEREKAWIVVENASKWLFQLLNEDGSVAMVCWPWSWTCFPLQPANARRQMSLHPVISASAAATAAQGVWVDLTTVLPIAPTSFTVIA